MGGKSKLLEVRAISVVTVFLMLSFAVSSCSFGLGEGDKLILENNQVRVEIAVENGTATVTDMDTGIVWNMKDQNDSSGYLQFQDKKILIGKGRIGVVFKNARKETSADFDSVVLTGSFPRPMHGNMEVEYRLWKDRPRLDLLIRLHGQSAQGIESITYPYGFTIDKGEEGYVVLAYKLGLIVPNSLDNFTKTFQPYASDYQMRMFGGVKSGADGKSQSAYLAILPSLYSFLELNISDHQEWVSTVTQGVQRATAALEDPIQYSFYFYPHGDYVDIATGYREWASENGLLKTFQEKMNERPGLQKSLGAQFIHGVSIVWDWQPAVDALGVKEFAERWRISPPYYKLHNKFENVIEPMRFLKEAGLEKAIIYIMGWNAAGHDGQNPDMLPANEDAGGNEKLAELISAIDDLGYVALLHEDIHIIYETSPSFRPEVLARDVNGAKIFTGVWPGGTSYLPNVRYIYDFALRNFPQEKELFGPTGIFLDVTANVELRDDYNREYPMTKDDDMQWRQRILDFAGQNFDVVASENFRDWGAPYYDYSLGYGKESYWYSESQSKLQGIVIPLWELVYHNSLIALREPLWVHDMQGALRPVDGEVKLFLRTLRAGVNPPAQSIGYQDARVLYGWTQGARDVIRDWSDMSDLQRIITMSKVSIPFHEEVFDMFMTDHKFLSEDYMVEESTFDNEVRVVVNGKADAVYRVDEDTVLSELGFVIDGITVKAYSANKAYGYTFDNPVLGVISSLDGKPVNESEHIRVFKGFGDDVVVFKNKFDEAELPNGTVIKKNENGLFMIPISAQQETELRLR